MPATISVWNMTTEKWTRQPKLVLWGSEYEGDGRAYVDPTDDNSKWPSVTSILKHEDKSDLIGWATLKVAERARDRTDIVMGDPDKVVDRLRYAHNDFRDERAWVGSGVHATIQSEFEDSWDFPELDSEQQAMMRNWYRFLREYKVEILKSEFTIRGDGYMGTADNLIRYTDPFTGETKVALTDTKTSRKLWPSHDMQLAALGSAWYILKEVPEGTPDSFLRKGKVKAENSWWVREEMPQWDVLAKIHLRDDMYSFEEVSNVEINYDLFSTYKKVGELKNKLKEASK